jgi:hypothetical protein
MKAALAAVSSSTRRACSQTRIARQSLWRATNREKNDDLREKSHETEDIDIGLRCTKFLTKVDRRKATNDHHRERDGDVRHETPPDLIGTCPGPFWFLRRPAFKIGWRWNGAGAGSFIGSAVSGQILDRKKLFSSQRL